MKSHFWVEKGGFKREAAEFAPELLGGSGVGDGRNRPSGNGTEGN